MDAIKPASTIDRKSFFASIRSKLFTGKMSQSQCDGIEAILKEWEARKLTDLRWLAYMLATAFHETAKTMQPIEEYGKGAHYDYGKKLKRSRKAYASPNQLYYGRGLVQLTWYENYEQFGELLKIDLLNNPQLACTAYVAVKIMFEGMLKGLFTSHRLEMYFNDNLTDWVTARTIINGMDKAEAVALYGKIFYKALAA